MLHKNSNLSNNKIKFMNIIKNHEKQINDIKDIIYIQQYQITLLAVFPIYYGIYNLFHLFYQ
jgi:hypothetical protein